MKKTIVVFGLSSDFQMLPSTKTKIKETADQIIFSIQGSKEISILYSKNVNSADFAELLRKGLGSEHGIEQVTYPVGHSNPCNNAEIAKTIAGKLQQSRIVIVVVNHDVEYVWPMQFRWLQTDFELEHGTVIFKELFFEELFP